jgi:hypothetical protein
LLVDREVGAWGEPVFEIHECDLRRVGVGASSSGAEVAEQAPDGGGPLGQRLRCRELGHADLLPQPTGTAIRAEAGRHGRTGAGEHHDVPVAINAKGLRHRRGL